MYYISMRISQFNRNAQPYHGIDIFAKHFSIRKWNGSIRLTFISSSSWIDIVHCLAIKCTWMLNEVQALLQASLISLQNRFNVEFSNVK